MIDSWEIRYNFNPLVWNDPNADSDDDGLTNLQESLYDLDPDNTDTDGDGIDDGIEVNLGLNPSKRDTDGDGIEDADELVIGTDPLQPDTDGDGLPDGWEYEYGMSPTTDNTTDSDPGNDPSANPDGDGLTNADESNYGTNPYAADTDGDGVNDGDEVAQGSDPLDPDDHEPRDTVTVSITFGDSSGSHSEKYRLTVKPVEGDPRPAQKRVNHKYGECETFSLVLVAGAKYAVTIAHVSTNLEDGPDPDYELGVWKSQSASGVVLLIDDPYGMLGYHSDSEWGSRAGHSVNLFCVRSRIIPDRDRDGVIDESDTLQANEPLRMWVNDDTDIGDTAEKGSDIPGFSISPHANADDGEVNGRRDLLDFFPVWLDVHELLAALPQKTVKCRLRHSGTSVNVVFSDLSNTAAGSFQKTPVSNCGYGLNEEAYKARTFQVHSQPGVDEFPPQLVQRMRMTAGKGVILLEGRLPSSAPLQLDIMTNDAVVCTIELPLSVTPVEQMFNQVSLRNGGYDVTQGSSLPPFTQSFGHVFFIHGFNVDGNSARAWGCEMFKRLWQSGSKARFHAVTWDGDLGAPNAAHYQENVFSAFETAVRLKQYVCSVQSGQKIVMAHSLGNMVVSSAIADHELSVSSYFMFNAAVAAEAFDASTWSDSPDAANLLVHYSWRDYTNITWSAKFNEFFNGNAADARGQLTWKSRFSSVPSSTELYNYYSSGDEVLELFAGTPSCVEGVEFWDSLTWGRYAWHKQETHKGRFDLLDPVATSWAGWGFTFNFNYQKSTVTSTWSNVVGPGMMSTQNGAPNPPECQTEYTLFSELGEHPIFKRLPSSMFSSTITEAAQNELLARGIPALSGPTGRQSINIPYQGTDVRDIDMNAINRPNDWGRDDDNFNKSWLHGDLKDMAFFYNFKLFEDIVTKGGLK